MRTPFALMLVGLAGGLAAQSMTDVTAAATGGAAGAAAGKVVSEGLGGILGKVANQTDRAAKAVKAPAPVVTVGVQPHVVATAAAPDARPLIEASPGLPKSGGVPLPPPSSNRAFMERPVVPPPPPAPEPVFVPEPPPPPPPPPEATADDLRKIAEGESREDVLKLGEPAFRITMFEEGHLEETYRYSAHNASFGTVRLVDGAVTKVEVK